VKTQENITTFKRNVKDALTSRLTGDFRTHCDRKRDVTNAYSFQLASCQTGRVAVVCFAEFILAKINMKRPHDALCDIMPFVASVGIEGNTRNQHRTGISVYASKKQGHSTRHRRAKGAHWSNIADMSE